MEYVIFAKKEKTSYPVNEWIEINGKHFEADLTLSTKFGGAFSMNGGRILSFLLTEDGETVGYWNKGTWEITIPDYDGDAYLAYLYFIHRYNRILSNEEERSIYVHESGDQKRV